MPAVIAVLLMLGVGLVVGSQVTNARSARTQFSTYRTRAVKGFGSWLYSLLVATLGVAAMIVLLFLVLFVFRLR